MDQDPGRSGVSGATVQPPVAAPVHEHVTEHVTAVRKDTPHPVQRMIPIRRQKAATPSIVLVNSVSSIKYPFFQFIKGS